MEMSEDIYENNENYMNENTVENPTTRNNQQPPNSGFIAAGCRWHILALVCQGLLCAFLLIVIIVLGIYINLTAERNQLKLNNYILTLERNQLKMDNYNLTVERDQLKTDNYNLTAERDQMMKQLTVLQQQWIYFNSSVYSITTEKKSWNESRQDCKHRGADLMIINSEEEQNFTSRCFANTPAWIGLNDIDSENNWFWVDGTALNTGFWWDGEPNNNGGNEDCVLTGNENSSLMNWNNFPCNFSVVGICERKV